MKIVIKIGTAVLVNESGILDGQVLFNIIWQVKKLMDMGHKVAVVTSGAVASCDNKKLSRSIRAAVGQPLLMAQYSKIAEICGIKVGQFLYSYQDLNTHLEYDCTRFNPRREYTKNVLLRSMDAGIVPVINANDIVFNNELEADQKYADNDVLAQEVAEMIEANLVLYLIDQPGLINQKNKKVVEKVFLNDGNKIKVVNNLLELVFSKKKKTLSMGGMESKICRAALLAAQDIEVRLLPGKQENAIIDSISGKKIGTIFKSK